MWLIILILALLCAGWLYLKGHPSAAAQAEAGLNKLEDEAKSIVTKPASSVPAPAPLVPPGPLSKD